MNLRNSLLREIRERVAGTERPAAVVVDVACVSGLAAIRSLGRAGVPVVALDNRRSALGFRSRYAVPVLCPDPQNEDEFVAFLARLGEALDGPLPVFVTHDEPLNAIARAAGELGDRFRYPFPAWNVLARIQSKRAQLEAAERAGVAVPRTAAPGSAKEARSAADELGYPVLVRPSSTEGFKRRFGRQALRCVIGAEVERANADAEEYEPLVQELVPRQRRQALHARQLPRRGRRAARALLRMQAARSRPAGSGPAAWVRPSGTRRSSSRACAC